MGIKKLIILQEDGSIKEDTCFVREGKSFREELREGLTPEIRKRVSNRINEILGASSKE